MTVWSDERIEAALAGLADELVVPDGPLDTVRPGRGHRPERVLIGVAAAVIVLALVLSAVPAGRRAVAGWLGLGRVRVERIDPGLERPPESGFVDGVAPLDVDVALAAAGVEEPALDGAGLGRPEAAGRPPEGGVVLTWDDGATTLWVRRPDEGDDVGLVKQLIADAVAEPVEGIGEAAILIEGDHVLATPARTVAADRVLWWVVDDVEHRLETDRSRADLLEMGRTLAG